MSSNVLELTDSIQKTFYGDKQVNSQQALLA